MRARRERIENIEKSLGRAWRTAEAQNEPQPGAAWERAAMARIRAAGPLAAGTPADWFGPTAWRLAPVAAALILVLGTWMLQMDFTGEIEKAALMDPIAFDVVNKLGIL